jgi:hypothetical protein
MSDPDDLSVRWLFSCLIASIATEINIAELARAKITGACHRLERSQIKIIFVWIASDHD